MKKIFCNKRNEVLNIDECYQCSVENKECSIIPEYLSFVREKLEEEVSNALAITKLLYCSRRSYLLSFSDYIIPVEEMYFLMRGSMAHLLIEKYRQEKDCIVETKFEKEYQGIKISGKPDKINLKTKTIVDYKTISGRLSDDYSLRWGNVRIQDILQVNLYKWLIDEKFEIENLEIIYLTSDCIVKKQVEIIQKNNKKYKELQKCFNRAEVLNKYWGKNYTKGMDLPPAERGWTCSYCWVKNICEEYENERKGKLLQV